jgi:hypothetical protein
LAKALIKSRSAKSHVSQASVAAPTATERWGKLREREASEGYIINFTIQIPPFLLTKWHLKHKFLIFAILKLGIWKI